MAGIYLHIPFCRRKCFYCDFYKSTALSGKPQFLDSISREMEWQLEYAGNEPVETIYFGGGTPSVLTGGEVASLMQRLRAVFRMDPSAEVTMEVNPDDITLPYLNSLIEAGINRLSIGIQSFSDSDLKQMNRRHTALQAETSVRDAARAGFHDISIDLIFGLPWLSRNQWRENLLKVAGLPVTHLSAYHLTYHEGTPFYLWLKKGTLSELSENESLDQFEELIDFSGAAGFEQYEISNFARGQAYSKHNSSYWNGKKYLGLGPSAHSFNGISRQWNVSNLTKYIDSISEGKIPFESEILTIKDQLNDYLITRMRTKWGISLSDTEMRFGRETTERILHDAAKLIESGSLQLENGRLSLTRRGIMVSDQVILGLLAE